MIRQLLFSGLILLLLSANVQAQPMVPCDSLKVDSVWLDQAGINRLMIRLNFHGFPNTLIGYPYFPCVFNQLGDTLARGQMNFFGQLGGSSQIYETTTQLNELPLNQTLYLQFVFNSDTCVFPYFSSTTSVRKALMPPPLAFPNPAEETLHIENLSEDVSYVVSTPEGTPVLTGRTQPYTKSINLGKLPRGIFILQLKNHRPILFMKK
jgi:hypothetical protein